MNTIIAGKMNNNKLIHINDDITENILLNGFHTIKNELFFINASLNKDLSEFIDAYNDLAIDSYVLEKEGYPYRKRRYGSFTYDTKIDLLMPNNHHTFYQSESANKAYGGIKREFSPIKTEILSNRFLQELIREDFSKFPNCDRCLSEKWFVGVQMFRVEATKEFYGSPTPEGIHQDEHHYVVQHMINKRNVKGGESSIYTLNKEKVTSLTLNNFLDSCYVKDEKVMHSVSSIECDNSEEIAIRDMLILDFELIQ